MQPNFIPTLLGLDLNAYSTAVSFHETFGTVSHAFGRYPCGVTEYSRIIKPHIVPMMNDPDIGTDALVNFALSNTGVNLLLVPCSDWYLDLVEKKREVLSKYYSFVIPDRALYEKISDKLSFYRLLSDYGIPHPTSHRIKKGESSELPRVVYPAVLKPSSSTEYYKHPFPGMEKVYFPQSRTAAKEIAERIFSSGYDKDLILQEYISHTREGVLTVLCDKRHGTRAAVLAEVVLEERAPGARGNYSALLVRPLDRISAQLIRFAESIGYHGVANFDILYRGEKAYVLEMNPRQGRSSDYLRGAGVCLASFLADTATERTFPEKFRSPEIYWRAVGDRTVKRYAKAPLVECVMQKRREGFAFSPFFYDGDLIGNPVRRLYVGVHLLRRGREIGKYAGRL